MLKITKQDIADVRAANKTLRRLHRAQARFKSEKSFRSQFDPAWDTVKNVSAQLLPLLKVLAEDGRLQFVIQDDTSVLKGRCPHVLAGPTPGIRVVIDIRGILNGSYPGLK